MTADGFTLIGWAAVMAVQVAASSTLDRRLGILTASQGATATFAAWAFAVCWRSNWGVWSIMGAAAIGALSGLVHLLLFWLAGREVLLVVSVLMSFFATELWVALPALTGGSGGLAVSGASPVLIALFLAIGAAIVALNEHAIDRLGGVATPAVRRLGLFAGVLGVPAGLIIGGTLAASSVAIGCAGAAGGLLAGFAHPSLFRASWSLTILATVVAPNVGAPVRILLLPMAFVVGRYVLRAALPVSVGYSQMTEMAFPLALILWSRLGRNSLAHTSPSDIHPIAKETTHDT